MRSLAVILALSSALVAAEQSAALRFDVTSVKLWQPSGSIVTAAAIPTTQLSSGAFNRRTTVAALITYAYNLQDPQLDGGADWVRTERYDIAARAGREVSESELREMIKALLADRFQLRVRTENREMRIVEIRAARSDGRFGPNLHDCLREQVPEQPFRAPTGGTVSVSSCESGIAPLATSASRQLQTVVVDRTGLTGQWWFVLYYAQPSQQIVGTSAESSNPDLPSLEDAVRDQLGLRLERTRGPVSVLVIDHIERPSEN